ncbi:MAG TPA: hypothetical protein VNA04_09275 [Thermoanaerobaculia bacterium]|nr:hypothetical protein [Thermoanaerobaculia bacterium]
MPANSARSHAVVTLVCPSQTELARWSAAENAGKFLVIPDVNVLEQMLRSPVMQASGEVVRVIIDGGADLDRFLYLVATLPDSFPGELLYIRSDGSGHLSTRELKTLRTVTTINEVAVEVYLRWHGLPARSRSSYPPEEALAPPAPALRPDKR